MRIGFLGAGRIATALATQLIAAGHDVVLSGSSGADKLAARADAIGAGAGTPGSAVEFGDVVVLAVQWGDVPAVLGEVGDRLDGKILLDVTNPLGEVDGALAVLPYDEPTTSERTAALAPTARVVKAFNHFLAATLATDPDPAAGRRVAYVAGDDPTAKHAVAELATGAGFTAVDTGTLAEGGALFQVGGPISQVTMRTLDN